VNLLVLGPQGAGKGTQAKRISSEHGIPHVSTGEMFRAAQAEGTEFGVRVGEIMASGQLVPDDLTIAMIEERLSQPDAAAGFVLDGFPRNLAQAEALDAMFAEHGIDLDVVVALQVPDEVAHERLVGRGRSDDTAEAIAQRLADYHEQTEPLIEYYRARDRLAPIDGAASEDDVFAQIGTALETAAEHVR
jgi:adenylate kinase